MKPKTIWMLRATLFVTLATMCAAFLPSLMDSTRAQPAAMQAKANGRIAFAARRSHNNYEIYTTNSDGSAVARLTNTAKDNFSPAWSPDGTKIAFASRRHSPFLEIYVMNADGTNAVRLTNNTNIEDFEPAWSPDGSRLAFTAVYTSGVVNDLPSPPPVPTAHNGADIFVFNADGSNLVRLTNGDTTANWGPTWSPDGSRIAFASNRDGNAEIYVMNADGANQTRITNHAASDFDPDWSPDGSRIAFASSRSENRCCGIPTHDEIYVMNADGSGVKSLTDEANFNNTSPAWSPDGTKITFQRYLINGFVPDTWHVYVMNADGSNRRGASAYYNGYDIQPDWQPLPDGSATPSGWIPTTPKPEQVDIQIWTSQGQTFAKVTLTFPDAGYRVTDWGQVVKSGDNFSVNAKVEKWTEGSALVITTATHIYELGALPPGDYTFTFKAWGTTVKSTPFKVPTGTESSNPIDDQREFVRWQYKDFLGREPDPAGWDFWTDNITKCNDPARRPAGQNVQQCIDKQRTTTSAAFYMSPEFQYTGSFVYRLYKGSLGRAPFLSEFTFDRATVSQGIVVNGQLSADIINQNKASLAAEFVQRGGFLAIYGSLDNTEYVNKLFQTTKSNVSDADKQALVNGLNSGSETRASVLQKVVDGIRVIAEGNQQFTTTYGEAFYNSEFNRAFVQMEYFGYMHRDPDAAGYEHWLAKLNLYGNYIDAEMVRSFVVSPEYRARFGQP